jgi:hypothetical protein
MLLPCREGTPRAAVTLIPAAIATPKTCESLQWLPLDVFALKSVRSWSETKRIRGPCRNKEGLRSLRGPGQSPLSFFAAALALVFSIKKGDSLLEFFKHVRVGFIASAKNYLLKRGRTDLLIHVYQNKSPCVSRQTEHNIKHCIDLL